MIIFQYYCYRHIRLDTNEVFYVGIAEKKKKEFKNYEDEYKRAYAFKSRNKNWKEVYAITPIKTEIIYECETKEEVKLKEKEFIKLYGRANLGLGPLVNLTDGGDGFFGYKQTEEHKEKLRIIGKTRKGKTVAELYGKEREETILKNYSKAKKGWKNPHKGKKLEDFMKEPEKTRQVLKNNHENMRGVPRSKEVRDRISKSSIGKIVSDEFRLKMSILNTGRQQTEEHRTHRYETMKEKGYQHSDETRRKISEKNKGQIVSQEQRDKISKTTLGKPRCWPVEQYTKDGELVKRFASVRSAAKETGIGTTTIHNSLKGKRNLGDYIWKRI